jgi:hypothetical protein
VGRSFVDCHLLDPRNPESKRRNSNIREYESCGLVGAFGKNPSLASVVEERLQFLEQGIRLLLRNEVASLGDNDEL